MGKNANFPCLLCKKNFKQKAYLREHLKIHTRENLFYCENVNCDRHVRGFASKGNLDKHERRHHDKVKYSCSFCDEEFESSHQRSYHLKKRKYKCIHCCHSNDRWGHLVNHCSKVHPDKKQLPKRFSRAFASCIQKPEVKDSDDSDSLSGILTPSMDDNRVETPEEDDDVDFFEKSQEPIADKPTPGRPNLRRSKRCLQSTTVAPPANPVAAPSTSAATAETSSSLSSPSSSPPAEPPSKKRRKKKIRRSQLPTPVDIYNNKVSPRSKGFYLPRLSSSDSDKSDERDKDGNNLDDINCPDDGSVTDYEEESNTTVPSDSNKGNKESEHQINESSTRVEEAVMNWDDRNDLYMYAEADDNNTTVQEDELSKNKEDLQAPNDNNDKEVLDHDVGKEKDSAPVENHDHDDDDDDGGNQNASNLGRSGTDESEDVSFSPHDRFILQLWLLDKMEVEILQEFEEQETQRSLFAFLQAIWTGITENELFKALSWIAASLSEFVSGVLLLNYLSAKDAEHLLNLYNNPPSVSGNLSKLLNLFVMYKFQRKLFLQYPQIGFMDSLPISLRQNLDLGFCPYFICKKPNNKTPDESIPLISNREYQLCFQISTLLMSLAATHAIKDNDDYELFSKHTTYMNKFVLNFMEKLPSCPREGFSCFQILKITAQSEKIATKQLSIPTVDKGNVEFHVHELIIKEYDDVTDPLDDSEDEHANSLAANVRHATVDDIGVVTTLLYQTEDKDMDKEEKMMIMRKLTIGVCEVAKFIGIRDIWRLLFKGGYHYMRFLECGRRDRLLAVLFWLKRENEITELIKNVPEIFSVPSVYHLTSRLSSEDLCFIVKQKTLNFSGINIYKILVKWAHYQCNKDCLNPMIAYNEKDGVEEYFASVKHALPLNEILGDLSTLRSFGFIRGADMDKALGHATIFHRSQ